MSDNTAKPLGFCPTPNRYKQRGRRSRQVEKSINGHVLENMHNQKLGGKTSTDKCNNVPTVI